MLAASEVFGVLHPLCVKALASVLTSLKPEDLDGVLIEQMLGVVNWMRDTGADEDSFAKSAAEISAIQVRKTTEETMHIVLDLLLKLTVVDVDQIASCHAASSLKTLISACIPPLEAVLATVPAAWDKIAGQVAPVVKNIMSVALQNEEVVPAGDCKKLLDTFRDAAEHEAGPLFHSLFKCRTLLRTIARQ